MSAPTGTVDRADFTVTYGGSALDEHRMNVRDLAPALLGLADVFQAANEALNPDEPQLSLDIKATGEGSFLVELAAIHEAMLDVLLSRDASGALAVLGFIGGGSGLFSWLKHRRHPDDETLANGAVRVVQPDGTTITFPSEVLTLARRSEIRRAAQAVIAPLERDGITRMDLSAADPRVGSVRVTEDDLPTIIEVINTEDLGPMVTDVRFTQLLTIVSPNFQPGNKWRLSDGGAAFWVSMEDAEFLARIDNGQVAFRKNDRITADVWLRQWDLESGEVHAERVVTRVRAHHPRSVQSSLFAEQDDQTSDGDSQ